MKTALTQYIEDLKKGNCKGEDYYIELEKKQIIESNINGTQEAFIIAFKSLSGRDLIFTDQDLSNQRQEAEQYYTSTFETNKET